MSIKITNDNPEEIFVRISSGNSQNSEYIELGRLKSHIWNREPGKYMITFCFGEIYETPSCIIKSPSDLYVDEIRVLRNQHDKNIIVFTNEPYDPNYYKPYDFISNDIKIINGSGYNAYFRINSAGEGSEDFFLLKNGSSDIWRRKPGEYQLQYYLHTPGNQIFRVRTGGAYTLTQFLGINDSDGIPVPQSIEEWDSGKKLQEKENKEDEDSKNKNLENIRIQNKSFGDIYMKITSDDGSVPKYVLLSSGQTKTWPRRNGGYRLSLSEDGSDTNPESCYVYAPSKLFYDGSIKNSITNLIIPFISNKNSFQNVEQNKIVILNDTLNDLYVRISKVGNKGSSEYFMLNAGKSDAWERSANTLLQMQFAFNTNQNKAPIYFVKAGNFYVISDDFWVRLYDGTYADICYDDFNPTIADDLTISNKDVGVPGFILIDNESNQTIKIRIKKGISGSDNFFPLESHHKDKWAREKGVYMSEFVTHNNSYRYYLESGNYYSFKDDKLFNNGKEIKLTDDQFETKIIPLVIEKNIGQIKIFNSKHNSILVRIKAKEKGSEDFWPIESNQSSSWGRENGKFLMEIIDSNQKCRFLVESSFSYNYVEFENLVCDQTGEKAEKSDKSFDMKQEIKEFNDVENIEEDSSSVPYYQPKPTISGSQFKDTYFPPELRIINSYDQNGNKILGHFYDNRNEHINDYGIKFKRPDQIFNNKSYYLFKDRIEPGDVNQGQVGDCWLISGIATLTVRPELIQKCFKTKSVNPQGYYELYFYEKGQKKIMFLDDHFPTIDNSPRFAEPNGEELWVLLMEKAVAKYEGGYSNIHGGFTKNALHFFTGGVTKYIRDVYNSWDEILSAIKRGHLLGCGSIAGNDTTYTSMHIAKGHAYSILDAKEYNNYSKRIRLLKLRNPWGRGEYTGRYRDNSSLWTPELIDYFKAKDAFGENGIFFMQFEEFCQDFNEVTICCI